MIYTLVNRLIAYLALVRQSTPAFNLLSSRFPRLILTNLKLIRGFFQIVSDLLYLMINES